MILTFFMVFNKIMYVEILKGIDFAIYEDSSMNEKVNQKVERTLGSEL